MYSFKFNADNYFTDISISFVTGTIFGAAILSGYPVVALIAVTIAIITVISYITKTSVAQSLVELPLIEKIPTVNDTYTDKVKPVAVAVANANFNIDDNANTDADGNGNINDHALTDEEMQFLDAKAERDIEQLFKIHGKTLADKVACLDSLPDCVQIHMEFVDELRARE